MRGDLVERVGVWAWVRVIANSRTSEKVGSIPISCRNFKELTQKREGEG